MKPVFGVRGKDLLNRIGERFGFTEIDEMEEGNAPLGEDVYSCAECGMETLATDLPLGGLCPNCGGALSDDNLKPAETVSVPRAVGKKKLPNGQEVISIIGGLELNTPINVNEIWDMPWLQPLTRSCSVFGPSAGTAH